MKQGEAGLRCEHLKRGGRVRWRSIVLCGVGGECYKTLGERALWLVIKGEAAFKTIFCLLKSDSECTRNVSKHLWH